MCLKFSKPWPIVKELKLHSRDSSVGRASDWRSEGPWFNPGSRHFWTTVQKRYSASKPHLEPARWGKPLLAFWRLYVAFSPMRWKWRIRVSIPVPLECKSSALPLELIPLVLRTFWKPRHCMNDMWTSIISNSSFTTPNMDGMGGWFVSLKQGLICSLQSQPPIAQLVERETVDQKQNQISLGRWFKSGSVDKVLRIPYGYRNVTYGDKVVEKWHIRAFCASSIDLSPKRFVQFGYLGLFGIHFVVNWCPNHDS